MSERGCLWWRARPLGVATFVTVIAVAMAACVSDGSDGSRGETLLTESVSTTSSTCWDGAQLTFGYDTNGDGAINDVAIQEFVCRLAHPMYLLKEKTVLHYQDDPMLPEFREALEELDAEGAFDLRIVTTEAELETELASGDIDVAIVQIHDGFIGAVAETAITNWVDEGGRLVFSTWNTSEDVIPPALGADFGADQNLLAAQFSDLQVGWQLPSTLAINNPSTLSVFSLGVEPQGDATSVCTWENGESCAVIANGGRTLMVGFLYTAADASVHRQLAFNLLGYVSQSTE